MAGGPPRRRELTLTPRLGLPWPRLGVAAGASLPPLFLLILRLSLREKEREAFERHREIDALQLHLRRTFQRARRKIQNGFNPGGNDKVEDVLGGDGGHGNDRDA